MKTVQVVIEVDSKNAEKNLSEVNEQLNIQRKVLIDLEKELLETESTLKSTSKTNLTAQKELTEKTKNLKNEIKLENLALKDLNQQKRQNISVINDYNEQQANSTTLIRGLDEFTGGYASSLKDVFNGFQESSRGVKFFISSLSNMQKALIATGIGALVVTLGVIAANWDKISNAVLNATGKNQDYLNAAEKVRLEEESKLKILETQQNILALQGYTEEQILEIRKKQSEQTLKAIQDELAAKKKAQAEEIGFIVSMKALADQVGLGFLANFFLGDEEEREENKKEIEAQEQEVISLMDKIAGMQLKLNEIKKAEKEMDAAKIMSLIGLREELLKTEQAERSLSGVRFDLGEMEKQQVSNLTKIKRIAASQELEFAQSVLNNLSGAFSKNAKAQKAIQIAQTSISTFKGATDAFTAAQIIPPPAGQIIGAANAAAVVAMGLANIRKIRNTQIPTGNSIASPSSGSPTLPRNNSNAAGIGFYPSTPTISAIPTSSQIAAQGGQQSNVRAYVVQTDINNQTALDKRINQRATL